MTRSMGSVLVWVLFAGCLGLSRAATAAPSAGWNDWSCEPSTEHPRPVVLLHGLAGNDGVWEDLAPHLVRSDFCVFSLTYGRGALLELFEDGGVAPLDESAREIEGFVDLVRVVTGADRVDLVGHSQGGLHALYLAKVLGRARDIGRVVTMGTDVHGRGPIETTELLDVLGLRTLTDAILQGFSCPACTEGLPGSPYRLALTEGRVAQRGVAYTLIFSRFDEAALVFAPLGSPFLREPGVRNLYVQDRCRLDLVGHADLPRSRSVAGLVANALDPALPIRCGIGFPVF